jgi:hypothetical protein
MTKGRIITLEISAEGEESFREVADFIKGGLSTAALKLWEKTPAVQREFFKCAIENFETEEKALADILSKLPPVDRDSAFAALANLLDSTMHIAGSASASDAAKFWHESEAQRRRGKARRKETPLQKRMDELSAQYRQRKPNATNHAVAQFVVANWGDETSPPDLGTVQRRLKKTKNSVA